METPTETPTETHDETIHDVKEILNEYFKLKEQYETQIMKNKKQIMNDTKLSKREKRSAFLKLKPQCINCKRPSGTKFVTSFFDETAEEESFRQYKATCGVIANPCGLNITVQIGKTDTLSNFLNTLQDDLNDTKNNIINHKNKLLFGCLGTEDALSKFDTLKDDLAAQTSLYELYLEIYNVIVDNDDKKAELKQTLSDYYIQIDKIQESIKKMNETDNIQYARDAVVINTDILTPIMDKLRSLKYNETTILRNENSNTCNLIQTVHSIEQMSYSNFTDKVVSYKVGVEFTKKKSIDNDESDNGNITQRNTSYQQIWSRLPWKLKDALSRDPEWMSVFMSNCINLRAKNQPCVFIAPLDLILPPDLLPSQTYDFGNETYNNAFKTLPKSAQATYLTLHATSNTGVINYDLLKNAMNDLVAKETEFSINSGYY